MQFCLYVCFFFLYAIKVEWSDHFVIFGKSEDFMNPKKNSPKMFLETVKKLREIIQETKVPIGGKLPSERVLAEQLQVGRSTVREALRSLELLGLIETRRGEGTFLSDYRKHQLVEVLSTFILQDFKSYEDVNETRQTLEKEAIRVICQKEKLQQHRIWDGFLLKLREEQVIREEIIREIIVLVGNRLTLKIWFLLKQFSGDPYVKEMGTRETTIWIEILENVKNGDEYKAISLYNQWLLLMNRSEV